MKISTKNRRIPSTGDVIILAHGEVSSISTSVSDPSSECVCCQAAKNTQLKVKTLAYMKHSTLSKPTTGMREHTQL